MRLVPKSGGSFPHGRLIIRPHRAFFPRRVATSGWSLVLLLAVPAVTFAAARGPGAAGGTHPSGRVGSEWASSGIVVSRFPDAAPRHHDPGQLECADCHLVVADSAGVPKSGTSGSAPPPEARTASNPAFLRASDPLDLCLSCHGGQVGIPDVLEADANGLVNRSAGHFGPPDVPSRRGHTLGHGLGRRDHGPGSGEATVTCIDCHDPHGNHVARNLRWPAAPEATPPLGLFVSPAAVGMSRYESASVSYGTLDGNGLREVSSLCANCHRNLSGAQNVDPDGDGICNRHPSYDSQRGSICLVGQGGARGTTAPAHWERGEGSGFGGTARVRVVVRGATDYASGCTVDAARDGVFCLTCHKAHGSDQPFGLVWPAEQGLTATGCDQCHNVAGASPRALAGAPPSPGPSFFRPGAGTGSPAAGARGSTSAGGASSH